jgi:hypothetical protein
MSSIVMSDSRQRNLKSYFKVAFAAAPAATPSLAQKTKDLIAKQAPKSGGDDQASMLLRMKNAEMAAADRSKSGARWDSPASIGADGRGPAGMAGAKGEGQAKEDENASPKKKQSKEGEDKTELVRAVATEVVSSIDPQAKRLRLVFNEDNETRASSSVPAIPMPLEAQIFKSPMGTRPSSVMLNKEQTTEPLSTPVPAAFSAEIVEARKEEEEEATEEVSATVTVDCNSGATVLITDLELDQSRDWLAAAEVLKEEEKQKNLRITKNVVMAAEWSRQEAAIAKKREEELAAAAAAALKKAQVEMKREDEDVEISVTETMSRQSATETQAREALRQKFQDLKKEAVERRRMSSETLKRGEVPLQEEKSVTETMSRQSATETQAREALRQKFQDLKKEAVERRRRSSETLKGDEVPLQEEKSVTETLSRQSATETQAREALSQKFQDLKKEAWERMERRMSSKTLMRDAVEEKEKTDEEKEAAERRHHEAAAAKQQESIKDQITRSAAAAAALGKMEEERRQEAKAKETLTAQQTVLDALVQARAKVTQSLKPGGRTMGTNGYAPLPDLMLRVFGLV